MVKVASVTVPSDVKLFPVPVISLLSVQIFAAFLVTLIFKMLLLVFVTPSTPSIIFVMRSEERRVGKEC